MNDWKKEFDSARPEQGWMPSRISGQEESSIRLFGYKYFSNGNIHEVTDWGNIKHFIASVEAQARTEGEFEGRLEAFETLHKYALKTQDIISLDLIEAAQKEILSGGQLKSDKE